MGNICSILPILRKKHNKLNMFTLFVVTLLFISSFASSEINVTVINCTTANDESIIEKFTISPPPPEKTDSNFTISGEGVFKVDVDNSTFRAITTVKGFPIYETSSNACAPDTITMPAGFGYIYYGGVKCPATKGEDLVVPVGVYISDTAPDNFLVITKVTAKDNKNGRQVFCVNVQVEMSG
eukprot:277479_1